MPTEIQSISEQARVDNSKQLSILWISYRVEENGKLCIEPKYVCLYMQNHFSG